MVSTLWFLESITFRSCVQWILLLFKIYGWGIKHKRCFEKQLLGVVLKKTLLTTTLLKTQSGKDIQRICNMFQATPCKTQQLPHSSTGSKSLVSVFLCHTNRSIAVALENRLEKLNFIKKSFYNKPIFNKRRVVGPLEMQ